MNTKTMKRALVASLAAVLGIGIAVAAQPEHKPAPAIKPAAQQPASPPVKLDKENDTNLKFVLNATSQKEAREKLQAAKQAAEEASRAKSEFLAVMSHELRTPLNGLIGMLRLMGRPEAPGEAQRFDLARRSAGDLKTLLDDILEHAKVGLSAGIEFGDDSQQFVRLNFGCPRAMLEEGLQRMEISLQNR